MDKRVNKKIKNTTPKSYNEIHFKSTLECNIAKLLDKLGINYEYEQQKFILIPSFKYNNTTIRAITYTPDFIIGDYIIECKGFPSDSWKIKRKLFMNYLNSINSTYKYVEIYSIKDMYNLIDSDSRFLTYNILVKDLKDNIIGEYNSVREAMESLGLENKARGNIDSCIIGNRNKAFNYKWSKIERTFIPEKNEEWRDVFGFEGLYYVSSLGRVASAQFHKTHNFKLMSQCTVKGYKFVKLRNWKNNISGSYPVHRLVAMAFIPNLDNKLHVDHIDTNPSNNNVNNLRWVTPLENQQNPLTNKRLKDNMINMNKKGIGPNASAKKKRRAVMLNIGNTIIRYPSITKAAVENGLPSSSICRWCSKQEKGWSYID